MVRRERIRLAAGLSEHRTVQHVGPRLHAHGLTARHKIRITFAHGVLRLEARRLTVRLRRRSRIRESAEDGKTRDRTFDGGAVESISCRRRSDRKCYLCLQNELSPV